MPNTRHAIIGTMIAKAFGAAFGLTFVAELGDKTQIAILTLSSRYGITPVFLGAAIAFVVLNALAVSVGVLLHRIIPGDVIRYIAAAVFIIYGLLSFRPEREKQKEKTARNPLLTTILVISLMELGDKTQLSLITLTAKYSSPLSVFLGGTAALLLTSLIGALVGEGLGRVLPHRLIRITSGFIFIIFGILVATGLL